MIIINYRECDAFAERSLRPCPFHEIKLMDKIAMRTQFEVFASSCCVCYTDVERSTAIQLATKCQPSLCVRYAEKCVRSTTFTRRRSHPAHTAIRYDERPICYLFHCLRSAFSSFKRRTPDPIHIMCRHTNLIQQYIRSPHQITDTYCPGCRSTALAHITQ